LNCST